MNHGGRRPPWRHYGTGDSSLLLRRRTPAKHMTAGFFVISTAAYEDGENTVGAGLRPNEAPSWCRRVGEDDSLMARRCLCWTVTLAFPLTDEEPKRFTV